MGRRASEDGDDGAAYRRQAWLRWAVWDFFFPPASARRRLCKQAQAIIVISACRCSPYFERYNARYRSTSAVGF